MTSWCPVTEFAPTHKVEAGDLFWFDFHGEIFPVEVLSTRISQDGGVTLVEFHIPFSGSSCLYTTLDKLLVKRIHPF